MRAPKSLLFRGPRATDVSRKRSQGRRCAVDKHAGETDDQEPLARSSRRWTLTEATAVGAVGERIAHVVQLLDVIDAAVGRHRARAAGDRLDAMLEGLGRVTTDQREAWTGRLDEIGAAHAIGPTPSPTDRLSAADDRWSAGDILEQLAGAIAQATASYVRLYATARLMFDAATCDLAAAHLRVCGEALQVINWLLPELVGHELESEGLGCRCVCPACSIGACLCVRNSTDTALHAWGNVVPFGTRGLPAPDDANELLDRWSLADLAPNRGVVLTAAPRRGSPLAVEGVQRRDRILEVNGVQVTMNPEIQNALTAHDVGDEAQVKVQRASGEVTNISVRRPKT